MSNFLQALQRFLDQLEPPTASSSRPSTVRGVHLHAPAPKNVTVNSIRRVGPSNGLPLAIHRGWKNTRGNIWHGSYVSKIGTFEGKIEQRGDIYEPYIRRVPASMQSHSRWCCFHKRPGGWWFVHLHTQPHDPDTTANVSAIIRYIEGMLAEVLPKR